MREGEKRTFKKKTEPIFEKVNESDEKNKQKT